MAVVKDVAMPIAAIGGAALGIGAGLTGGIVWISNRQNELGALKNEIHRLHEENDALREVQDSAMGHLQYTPPPVLFSDIMLIIYRGMLDQRHELPALDHQAWIGIASVRDELTPAGRQARFPPAPTASV